MKVWELEEGEEYVAYDRDFGKRNYKIVNGEFLYFDDDGWSLSLRKFKELNELDFTEYIPPIDWSKVPIDTKILVKNNEKNEWTKRHFAKYENDRVYAWSNGYTSFTADVTYGTMAWNTAKLYDEKEVILLTENR